MRLPPKLFDTEKEAISFIVERSGYSSDNGLGTKVNEIITKGPSLMRLEFMNESHPTYHFKDKQDREILFSLHPVEVNVVTGRVGKQIQTTKATNYGALVYKIGNNIYYDFIRRG
ncbi:MAG: hypothetical protein ACP5N3_01600 [Candidatus Nanoarchaeia archaeon]